MAGPEMTNDNLALAINSGSDNCTSVDKIHQELFLQKNHDRPGGFDKGISEAADFANGLWQGAFENPVNGAIQAISHLADVHLPELHLVDEKSNSIGSIAGKITGQALDFYALSLATSGLGSAGYIGSTLKMGSVGGAYVGLLQPTDPNSKHFWTDRGINSVVALGTFAGMGATAAILDSTAIFAAPAARSFVGSLAYGGISGVGAGIAHAEANSLVTKRRLASEPDLLSDSASFALFGTMYGAAGYGYCRLTNPSSYATASAETTGDNTHAGSDQEDSGVSINQNTSREIPTRPWHRFNFLTHHANDEVLDPQVAKVISDNLDSVVAVVPYKSIDGGRHFMHSMGTGFFVDEDGTIATAQHVIPADADGSIVVRQNGEVREADILKTTDKYDLNLLKINPDSPVVRDNTVVLPKAPDNEMFPSVRLAEDPSLSHGDSVVAIGFPFGHISASPGTFDRLDMPPEISGNPRLAKALSSILGEQYSNINIAPGNSGSPLFRTGDGAVVGVVTQRLPGSVIKPQQGGSIPVNFLKNLIGI